MKHQVMMRRTAAVMTDLGADLSGSKSDNDANPESSSELLLSRDTTLNSVPADIAQSKYHQFNQFFKLTYVPHLNRQ